jgi:hypothetical protein
MMKPIKIRQVDPKDHVIYWNRAEDFYQAMVIGKEQRLWNAVGLLAIHCTISLSDALLVRVLRLRSIGDDHKQVLDLLTRVKIKGIEEQVANARRIIAKKNAIEYENRNFREKEAEEIFKQAGRFHQGVTTILNKLTG